MNKFTEEDDFILIFGQQEFLNSFLAEFISPVISRLHQADPTITSIKFDELYLGKTNDFNLFISDIITSDTISLLFEISSGSPIKIDETQAFKMRFLSIILGNEELFFRINEIFPPDFNDENLDVYLEYIECCYHFSQFSRDFDFSSLIESIDKNKFLKIPRSIQFSIISNPHLTI